MQKHEFDTVAGLEEAENRLARASRHPVHVDLGASYTEGGVTDLGQLALEDEDVEDRLSRVDVQPDLHVVWNNRDDRRAYMGSDRYNLIQHREVIDAIREAVASTTGSIDKGIIRDHGEHVDGVLVFGDREDALIDVRELVGDGYVPPEGAKWTRDRLGLGMRFHNSFNGRSGYGGTAMAYRYICANWMVWGEEEISSRSSYHIKGDAEAPGVSADYFESVIGEVFEQKDPLEGIVKGAVEDGELPLEWTPAVLEEAGFGPNYQKRISRRVLEQEHPREGETTLWNVYNAATAHLDNDKEHDLGPERYDHHQGSAWSILDVEPEPPEEEPGQLEAFAAGISA